MSTDVYLHSQRVQYHLNVVTIFELNKRLTFELTLLMLEHVCAHDRWCYVLKIVI